jgi:hypothetical protein
MFIEYRPPVGHIGVGVALPIHHQIKVVALVTGFLQCHRNVEALALNLPRPLGGVNSPVENSVVVGVAKCL